MKKTIIILVAAILILSMPAAASFADVESDHWAYDAINKLTAAGVIEGYHDGEFKGDQNMTRYEIAVMINRVLDDLKAEREELLANSNSELSEAEVSQVETLVDSLLAEKVPADTLSDKQTREVSAIVSAMTSEFKEELEVLNSDVEMINEDLDMVFDDLDYYDEEIANLKSDMPKDNVEFSGTIDNKAEIAYYGEDQTEEKAVVKMLSNIDAMDIHPLFDRDDFPAKESYWQEYSLNINGNLKTVDFNIDLNAINNTFVNEETVFENFREPGDSFAKEDQNDFSLDKALLEVAYDNTKVKIGDFTDYHGTVYFNNSEDREGLEITTNLYDTDIRAFAMGSNVDNVKNEDTGEFDNLGDQKFMGVVAGHDTSVGRITGKVFHARNVIWDVIGAKTELERFLYADNLNEAPFNNTVAAVQLERPVDFIMDGLFFNGEVAVSTVDDYEYFDETGYFTDLKLHYHTPENWNLNGWFQYADENYLGAYSDIASEEEGDYTFFQVDGDYTINANNSVNGFLAVTMPGDFWKDRHAQDVNINQNVVNKIHYHLNYNNTMGDFSNRAGFHFVNNDFFKEDANHLFAYVGSDYNWTSDTTVGAQLNYKQIDNEFVFDALEDRVFTEFFYLTGFVETQLAKNVSWRTDARYITGDTNFTPWDFLDYGDGFDYWNTEAISGSGYSLTTSLSISF